MGPQVGILGFVLAAFCFSLSLQSEETLVPVLVWNYKNPGDLKFSHNSLHNIDTSSFTSHMQKMIKKSSNPLVLCFVEPLLSVEDFSTTPTAFTHIKNEISQAKLMDYMPSVYDASEGLHNLENVGLKVKEIYDSDNIVENIAGTDVLIVKMSEADENRFNTLEKHDKFMAETYKKVFEQRKNVIGVLTSEISMFSISTLIRSRRSEGSSNENASDISDFAMNDVFKAGNKNGRAMLYSKSPAVLTLPTGTTFQLSKTPKTETKLDDRTDFQRLLITYYTPDGTKINARFRFDKDLTNTWSLKIVELESTKLNIKATNLTTTSSISGTMGHAYSTLKEVEFSNDENIRLVFPSGFTVQPWIPDMLGERFGEVDDTVQYFTPGIWMGIFVMTILAMVFTLGMIMILDIKTMDRFDDAKGKTITINATD
ncbi:hypothetical protein M8J76_012916 [Diaphorina citri]|nr:hypothetical protein M8J75_005745 [Diaphorina citri]KAI5714208.1 hypothetical protein M8J76_012916 [Diaphorina citri]